MKYEFGKAPLLPTDRCMLSIDGRSKSEIFKTAKRKSLDIHPFEAECEYFAYKHHFELGCWLYYLKNKIGFEGEEGFEARVRCALLIFSSGILNPRYDFFTVFEFGQRQFDTIFEMGDSDLVIAELWKFSHFDGIKEAFQHYQWGKYKTAENAVNLSLF